MVVIPEPATPRRHDYGAAVTAPLESVPGAYAPRRSLCDSGTLLGPPPFAAGGNGYLEEPCHGTRIAGWRGASCASCALISVRAIVLHNPAAGSGDVSAADLLAALAAGGIASRYCSTKQS